MPQLPDLDQLRLNASGVSTRAAQPLRRERVTHWFLKGPIPWDWITRAASLPGKALHVGIGIWFWSGIKRTKKDIPVSLSRIARDFGFDHSTSSRALGALERASLITVVRSNGRKVVVSLRLQEHEGDPESL